MVETICSLQEEDGDGKAHCIVMVGTGSSNCTAVVFLLANGGYRPAIE